MRSRTKDKKATDQELAILLKEDDQEAYTAIFERYNTVLYRHAFRLLGEQDGASDVIQDVFMTLWQKRGSINFNTSLRAYLYRAVRNRIFDLIAHKEVVARYADSIRSFWEQSRFITDDQVRENELAAIIEREIDCLPPRMREVFLLSRREELSYTEISEQMNISAKTAKQQVYNAVKLLKLKISSFLSVFPFA